MIAFLHTLNANVDKFEALAKKHAPEQETQHFVNEAILIKALKTGVTDYEGFNAEVEKIKALQPELIICTCSSYGEASDRRGDVERIDRPIVEYMLTNYSKIGLAFAATSTRSASANLITNTAKTMHKEVTIIDINCSAAWPHFEKKNMKRYDEVIADTIKEQAENVEVIFLAQASMEGTKEHLKALTKEVLSSPEFGVRSLF